MEQIDPTTRIVEAEVPQPADQPFFVRHREGLTELFEIVGLPSEAISSLDVAVEHTQPWIKGDHSDQKYPFDIKVGHYDRLHELYVSFGQVNEIMLPPGKYSDVMLLGGLQAGNRRRLSLLSRAVREHGIVPERVALLGGQRHLFPNKEKDDTEATLSALMENSENIMAERDPWAANVRTANVGRMWETDGIRMAALEHMGSLALRRIDLRFNQPATPEGADPVLGYEFDWDDVPVSLMHTLAVARPQGERRHTTEACVLDWLQRRNPSRNARIGFIAANPHTERMGLAAEHVLRTAGRGDLRLEVAGSATPADLGHGYFLGEIARLLYENRRSQQQTL